MGRKIGSKVNIYFLCLGQGAPVPGQGAKVTHIVFSGSRAYSSGLGMPVGVCPPMQVGFHLGKREIQASELEEAR